MGNTTRTAVAISMALTLGLTACGDETSADPEPTTAPASDPASDPAGDTVAITAVNYAFEGVPATVAAGTKLTLTNASEDEVHELVAMRIPDEEDRPVAELAALPEDEVEKIFPEDQPPAAVLVAAPGEDGFAALGDGTLDQPGRYALVCFIPTGADPEEFLAAAQSGDEGPPDVQGGPPHVVHGMFAELTVE